MEHVELGGVGRAPTRWRCGDVGVPPGAPEPLDRAVPRDGQIDLGQRDPGAGRRRVRGEGDGEHGDRQHISSDGGHARVSHVRDVDSPPTTVTSLIELRSRRRSPRPMRRGCSSPRLRGPPSCLPARSAMSSPARRRSLPTGPARARWLRRAAGGDGGGELRERRVAAVVLRKSGDVGLQRSVVEAVIAVDGEPARVSRTSREVPWTKPRLAVMKA